MHSNLPQLVNFHILVEVRSRAGRKRFARSIQTCTPINPNNIKIMYMYQHLITVCGWVNLYYFDLTTSLGVLQTPSHYLMTNKLAISAAILNLTLTVPIKRRLLVWFSFKSDKHNMTVMSKRWQKCEVDQSWKGERISI